MRVSTDKAQEIGDRLGVDWKKTSLLEFWQGVNTELEHKSVVKDDLELAGIIALDHLKELPDYYSRLIRMESSR